MNSYISIQLQDFAQKVRGYNMLFNYRLMNLCVKAEPAALIPVIVTVDGKDYDLEKVADIRKPDDYFFEVRSKNENNLQAIIEGIFDAHPEFILDMKTEKDMEDKEVPYAKYSMPPVDKNRRDLLCDLTKTFYNECIVHIDAAHVKQEGIFVEALFNAPIKDANEAKDELKEIYDSGKKEAEAMRDTKLKEIEEAYLNNGDTTASARHSDTKTGSEELDYDVTKGFRVS